MNFGGFRPIPGAGVLLRGLVRATLASAMALPLAWSAMACSVVDGRPYSQQLESAPLAFVGTVTSVMGPNVTFAVHHAIAGNPGAFTTVKADPPSTCAISFATGQRWLYAGPAAKHPTQLLLARTLGVADTEFGPLRRVDDARAELPSAWQACSSNTQCVPVRIGCRVTAANAAHASEAQAQAILKVGDHRAMECSSPPAEVLPLGKPQCVAARCGSWVLDMRPRAGK